MTTVAAPEDLDVYLTARSYLYRLFQNLFGAEPTPEGIAFYSTETTAACLEVVSPDMNEWTVFCDALERAATYDPDGLDDLKTAYTLLFVGPGAPKANPWESLHIGAERRLFTEVTLSVKRAFKAQGLAPDLGAGVADDGLALELDFLATLADRARKAQVDWTEETGDATHADSLSAQAIAPLEASLSFLRDHLNRWIEEFQQDVAKADSSSFYATAAAALASFCKLDEKTLADILSD